MGDNQVIDLTPQGMGAEDYPFFTTEPYIPSVYYSVGGTSSEDLAEAKAGGKPVASHHSPLFKIEPKKAVISGVESTVLALMELMGK